MANIIVTKETAREAYIKSHIHPVSRYPFVEEYTPGSPRHKGDDRVAALNAALMSMSERIGGRQTFFAAFHEKANSCPPTNMFGVIVWSVDKETGELRIHGNPECDTTSDPPYRIGLPKTEAIVKFFLAHFDAVEKFERGDIEGSQKVEPLAVSRAENEKRVKAEVREKINEQKEQWLSAALANKPSSPSARRTKSGVGEDVKKIEPVKVDGGDKKSKG